VLCVFSFELWFFAVEPPSLVHVRSIRVLTVFLSFDPHAPFLEKKGGVGDVVLPSFGRVSTASGELLTGEFECEPVFHSIGVD
jgi:hypothetical protein